MASVLCLRRNSTNTSLKRSQVKLIKKEKRILKREF